MIILLLILFIQLCFLIAMELFLGISLVCCESDSVDLGIFWQECEDNSYIRQIAKSVGHWSASVSINPPVNPKFLRLKRSSPNSANQCSRTTWFPICHCTMLLIHTCIPVSSFSSIIFDVRMSDCQHFIWCKYTLRSLQERRLIVKLFTIS